MNDIIDCWQQEDFEETVNAALIACFESKIKKNKGVPPHDNLKEKHLQLFRSTGPYMPSKSRFVYCDVAKDFGFFDIKNDKLPDIGCFGFNNIPHQKDRAEDEYNGYFTCMLIRKTEHLGKLWHRKANGALFEMLVLSFGTDSKISGERRYFTVKPNGEVVSCFAQTNNVKGSLPGVRQSMVQTEPEILHQTQQWASLTLQFLSDKRFCWSITAQEEKAKAELGCMYEEIKSLLYARNLPLTATGRKRPILHLVRAHKRRLEKGIDIDIKEFLRGTRQVEMNGTKFTVNPPANISSQADG